MLSFISELELRSSGKELRRRGRKVCPREELGTGLSHADGRAHIKALPDMMVQWPIMFGM